MQITTSEEALTWFTDELLRRWESKLYPFNRPDAIIPQTIIPDELRKDKEALAAFYVAVNNDMKGKVTSLTAFKGYIAIWKKYPWFFDPRRLLWETPSRIIEVYEEFLPIDKFAKTKALFINYRHLMQYYDSSALNLFKGCDSYDEALRRIRNKRTKKELREAGYAGEGLFNHQHKMVSMLVYFYDWERLLKSRFIYPPPGDIQNFRGGLSSGSLIVSEMPENGIISNYELIAAPWREITTNYIRKHNKDPRDVADVYWLFGSLFCGNSPLTVSNKRPKRRVKKDDKYDKPPEPDRLFDDVELPVASADIQRFLQMKHRRGLEETCLLCPVLDKCKFAIPVGPYYDKGELELRLRPRVEDHIDRSMLREPEYPKIELHPTFPFVPLE